MKKILLSLTSLLILVAMVLVITSCDDRTTDLPIYSIDGIFVSSETIYADNNNETYAEVSVKIVDDSDIPVEGEVVTFSCNVGNIEGSATTNSQGLAIVKFYDVGVIETANIVATYNEESATTQIEIIAIPSYYIDQMIATPDTIFADDNITYSTISVIVKDNDGFNVADEQVSFLSDIGNLITLATTNENGIAETTFWDVGDLGTATIEAFVGDQSASVNVEIIETPAIESVDLTVVPMILVNQVTQIRAECLNNLGEIPSDGTLINFSTNMGYFVDAEGNAIGTLYQTTIQNGIATLNMNAGTESGVCNVSAYIGEVIATESITVLPGNPVNMILVPSTDTVPVNGEDVLITAEVFDRYYNHVADGVDVAFTTTIGSIGELTYTTGGFTETTFSPGISSGIAIIEAVADSAQTSTAISVVSDAVHHIEFASTNLLEMSVQGTGGLESVDLQVNLFDMNGNFVSEPYTVYFELVSAPNGTTISESAASVNGIANVAVNSGIEPGTIIVRAYIDEYIFATRSQIVIHAGPAASVDFGIGEFNSGEEFGSGLWRVGVSALVNDIYGNPVANGTGVWFSVYGDAGETEISWANIIAQAGVGNVSVDGDSLPGVAFTALTYDGSHTNDEIYVKANIGDDDFYGWLALPLNQPVIDMVPVPAHVDFYLNGNNGQDLTAEIDIVVTDSQGNFIHDALIQLYGDRGIFQYSAGYTQGSDYHIVKTDAAGYAKAIIEFQVEEVAPAVPPPGQQTVQLNGTILGTETMDQTTIILLNYQQ